MTIQFDASEEVVNNLIRDKHVPEPLLFEMLPVIMPDKTVYEVGKISKPVKTFRSKFFKNFQDSVRDHAEKAFSDIINNLFYGNSF